MHKSFSVVWLIVLVVASVISCASEKTPRQEARQTTADEQRTAQEAGGTTTAKAPMARPQEAETGAKQIVAPQTRSRQANDVMSGKPVSTSIYADYAGKRIYFCCEESRRRFNTDPEAWMKAAREQGITLEDTPAKR